MKTGRQSRPNQTFLEKQTKKQKKEKKEKKKEKLRRGGMENLGLENINILPSGEQQTIDHNAFPTPTHRTF